MDELGFAGTTGYGIWSDLTCSLQTPRQGGGQIS